MTNEAGSAGRLDVGFEVDRYGESGRVRLAHWWEARHPLWRKA